MLTFGDYRELISGDHRFKRIFTLAPFLALFWRENIEPAGCMQAMRTAEKADRIITSVPFVSWPLFWGPFFVHDIGALVQLRHS